MTQYCVPYTYISAGVPRRVMADMKLQAMDIVVGKIPICLLARRNSLVFDCPRQAKNTPMRAESRSIEARTRYSSQPKSE